MKKLLLLILIVFSVNIDVYSQIEIPEKLKIGSIYEFKDVIIYTHRNVDYHS